MMAYVDASVLLRFVLEQPRPLTEVEGFDDLVTSTLAQSECLRAVDNARLRGEIGEDEYVPRRRAVFEKVKRLERVFVTHEILGRVDAPFPVPIGTLDAIHVATALVRRDRGVPDLVFATHDHQQGKAAQMLGFEVIGL